MIIHLHGTISNIKSYISTTTGNKTTFLSMDGTPSKFVVRPIYSFQIMSLPTTIGPVVCVHQRTKIYDKIVMKRNRAD